MSHRHTLQHPDGLKRRKGDLCGPGSTHAVVVGVLDWKTNPCPAPQATTRPPVSCCDEFTSPFDPKEEREWGSIDSPKAKATQRLHLFPWRRD